MSVPDHELELPDPGFDHCFKHDISFRHYNGVGCPSCLDEYGDAVTEYIEQVFKTGD